MIEYIYIKNILSVEKFDKYISNTLAHNGIIYRDISREVIIQFGSELSAGDLNTLDSLVESYTNPAKELSYLHRYIHTSIANVEELDWVMLCSWVEPGNETLTFLTTRCKLLPATPDDSLDPGFEYYVRVFDVTNNTILGQSTFTNKEYSNGTTTISGFSGNESVLELQIKKSTKGSRVSVTNIMCKYL